MIYKNVLDSVVKLTLDNKEINWFFNKQLQLMLSLINKFIKSILTLIYTMNKEALQKEFDRLTNRGIIFGIIWIMGVGSIIALISGYQAGKIFKESGNTLEGKNKITKSYIAGFAGILLWIIAILIIIIFRKN